MAFSMFCAIPLPFHIWDEACLNLVLTSFPIVGLFLGIIWWVLAELLSFSGIPIILTVAILTVTPFLLTGFLHLDGFMDTSDAVFSRRPIEEKLRILKDPHLGAFSVIALVILFILFFAAMYVLVDEKKHFIILIFINIISRCCASFSLLSFKTMPQSNYANMFRQNTKLLHKCFLIFIVLLTAGIAYKLSGLNGLIVIAFVIFGFFIAILSSYRELKGVSGDTAGYSLVISELFGLFSLAII